jgi:hypothetical protein
MRETTGSKKLPVTVCGGNKYGRYEKISSEQTYNMFISDGWLINTAGYQKLCDDLNPGFQGRAIFASIRGGFLILIAGNKVFSFNIYLQSVQIGTLNTSSGEIFIDENLNSQICIVDGANAYIYNYAAGPKIFAVQTLLDSNGNPVPLTPNYVSFHNSFFLFGNARTDVYGSQWYAFQTNTNAPTNTTQLVLASNGTFTLQTKPDFAQAVVRLPSQSANVLVIGTSVSEIWTNVGGLQNYRKNTTVNVDYGCVSVSTIVTSDTYVAWLAKNENNSPVIMLYTGQGFEEISTDGIDYQLSQIEYPNQSTAMFYRQDGHLFYQLTFYNPSDNITFLYDLNTKLFLTLTDAGLNYHPARDYCYFNNSIYFISIDNAALYLSSTDCTTYNENVIGEEQKESLNYDIPRVRVTDTIRSEDSSQFRVNTFSFTIEQGCDPNCSNISLINSKSYLLTEYTFYQAPHSLIYTEYGIPIMRENPFDVGSNVIPYQPRIDLSVSRDGGITWSNDVKRDLHTVGYRQNILNWDKIGSANSITFKIKFLSTSRIVAYNGFVEVC